MNALGKLLSAGVLLLGLGTGCQTSEYPAPISGTTYRIGKDEPSPGSEMRVDILTTATECANAKIEDISQCVPYADRASGEMKFSFDLRDPVTGSTLYRSLDRESLALSHDASVQDDLELIPHDPVTAGQLFILVIDGSGSMYENDGARIKKVYDALLTPAVARGFLPEDNGKTGVVLLRFSQDVKGLDGGPPRVIKTVADYRSTLKKHLLEPHGGYTHLYDAVRYSVTDLVNLESIDRFLAIKSAEPTVIVLTDGFNNEAADDTCGTNVDRLNSLLSDMREVRSGQGAGARATVYTVGFGKPYRRGDKPEGFDQSVTPNGLCDKYVEYKIDGGRAGNGLEDAGIDHVSLAWIAEAAGGISYVKRDSRGLAETFERAARARYRWYELRYRVPDPFHHRKGFDVKLRLQNVARAETTVRVFPSPWLDAPGGVREPGQRWTHGVSLWRSVAFVLPILGGLLFLFYVGPAFFNARRALFRRARPRGRGGKGPGDAV